MSPASPRAAGAGGGAVQRAQSGRGESSGAAPGPGWVPCTWQGFCRLPGIPGPMRGQLLQPSPTHARPGTSDIFPLLPHIRHFPFPGLLRALLSLPGSLSRLYRKKIQLLLEGFAQMSPVLHHPTVTPNPPRKPPQRLPIILSPSCTSCLRGSR